MLAEGWKEANIRMGLLGLGRGEGQSSNTAPKEPHPQDTGDQTLVLQVSGTGSR